MAAMHRKKILLVEDDEALAKLTKWNLELAGFVVQTETSGAGALRHTAEHQPDLVILDLQLPDINGLQVARELRRLHRPWLVPVVMLTGLDKPIDQLRGFAHGADAYLTKPCDAHELLTTIALLLKGVRPTEPLLPLAE